MNGTTLTYICSVVDGTETIIRSTDGTAIPCNLANRDYQEFLTWMAEGNPAPAGWTGPTNSSG